MKQIRVMISVAVTTVDDKGQPLGQTQGFKVGNQLLLDPQMINAIPGLINTTAQELIVECLPSAYMESAERWGEEPSEAKTA